MVREYWDRFPIFWCLCQPGYELVTAFERVSDFLDAECFAVAVHSGDLSTLPETDRDAINRHLLFARNLHIETRILEGEDVAPVLVDFAGATRSRKSSSSARMIRNGFLSCREIWGSKWSRSPKDMQVVIVSDREPVVR